jgi:ribosomal protein L29
MKGEIMSEITSDLRDKSSEELNELIKDCRENLLAIDSQGSSGGFGRKRHPDKPHLYSLWHRTIARAKTILRERNYD